MYSRGSVSDRTAARLKWKITWKWDKLFYKLIARKHVPPNWHGQETFSPRHLLPLSFLFWSSCGTGTSRGRLRHPSSAPASGALLSRGRCRICLREVLHCHPKETKLKLQFVEMRGSPFQLRFLPDSGGASLIHNYYVPGLNLPRYWWNYYSS